jgi:hypothetical protein|nr:MAG TPA: hypothetical protein [Caudoviricetes sp.]
MADTTEVIYADRDRCCNDRDRGYGAGGVRSVVL